MPQHLWNSLLLTIGILPLSLVLPPALAESPISTAIENPIEAVSPDRVSRVVTDQPPIASDTALLPAIASQPPTVHLIKAVSPVEASFTEAAKPAAPTLLPSQSPKSQFQPPSDIQSSPAPAAQPASTDQPPASPASPDQSPASAPAQPVSPPDETSTELIKTSAEIERHKQLAEADRLYQAGQKAEAEKIYRTLKTPFADAQDLPALPEPITDAELLSPGGQVFWQESTIGIQEKIESRILVPLKLLIEKHPQFVPGHLRLAQALTDNGKPDQALAVLEKAAALYPNQPDLLKAKIAALSKTEKWMEAAIAARQFALLNPDNALAAEFITLADENQKQYQRQTRRQLNSNLVGGILTGALSYALTGGLYGPLNAVQATALMLRGESAVGDRLTKQAKRQLELVEDPEVVDYVNEVGQKLVTVAGRNDFKYEFFVVMDDTLNAFALPGGKVFVNLGAIAKTHSEAELAGLLAHELSHAVLSHGFQLMTEGTLTANVTQFIPYVGGIAGDLIVLNYSRDMERQADTMGTRILASADYAADGLRNLMVTLQQQEEKKGENLLPKAVSSHPATLERVRYLETLITQGGYNRYAYEGVERHAAMQTKVEKMLKVRKAEEEAKGK